MRFLLRVKTSSDDESVYRFSDDGLFECFSYKHISGPILSKLPKGFGSTSGQLVALTKYFSNELVCGSIDYFCFVKEELDTYVY